MVPSPAHRHPIDRGCRDGGPLPALAAFRSSRTPRRSGGWKRKLAERRDRHLRLAAEFDNFRKRAARERSELADRAQAALVVRLLDVLDDLDRVLAGSDPTAPAMWCTQALVLIDRKLRKELEAAGLERIDPVGQPVRSRAPRGSRGDRRRPTPEQDHTVAATFQAGYRFKGALDPARPGAGLFLRRARLTWPRDFYQVLGVPTRHPGGDQEGLSAAGQAAPSGRQSEQPAGRRALQGDLRGARACCPMPTSGSSTTRCGGWARSMAERRPARRGPVAPGRGGPAGSAGAEDSTSRDLGGFGLGDIFSSIFGRRRGARRRPSRDDRDGGRDPVPGGGAGRQGAGHAAGDETCATCAGSGRRPAPRSATCPECNGRGTITFGQGGFAVNRPCPQCRGRGKIPSTPCPTCGGAGEVRTEREVLITVPPGTETGAKVRLRGQGQPGAPGAPAGDLVVTFQVQPDRFFHRDGLDLVCEVPINLAQAVLRHPAPGPHARREEGGAHGSRPALSRGGSSGSRGWGSRRAERQGRSAGAGAGADPGEADPRAGRVAEEVRRGGGAGATDVASLTMRPVDRDRSQLRLTLGYR